MLECYCSEEFGPCDLHCEVLVSREGASHRTSDELLSVFIDDAVALGAAISSYGRDIVSRADSAMQVDGPMSNWLPDTEEGYELRDALQTVANQMETELYTLGYSIYWEDGYRVVKITGGPLAEDDV
jgi:hypothetical protein